MFALLCGGTPILAQSTHLNRAPRLAEIAFEYAEAERLEKAVSLLEQAEVQVEDGCFVGNTLLKIGVGYLNAGQAARGEQFLTQAFETAHQRTLEGCAGGATTPEESLLNRAVEYAEAGHFELALPIVEGVDNLMTPLAMAEIAGYYHDTGQQQQAKQILIQAIAQSREDPLVNLLLLGMTSIQIEAGRPNLAKFVIDEMGLAQPQALNSSQPLEMVVHQKLALAHILIALDQSKQALALLEKIVLEIQALPDFPSWGATNQLIEAALLYNSLGQVSQAGEVLEMTRALLPQMSGDLVDTQVNLVRGYAAMGEFDQARALAESIKDKDVSHPGIEGYSGRERAFGEISAEYARAGLTEAATSLAQSLGWPEFVMWNMFRAYLETEQYSQAQQLAQQTNRPEMLWQIGQAYLEAGDPERALQLIDLIPPDVSLDWLRQGIAISFAKQSQFDQALDLVQTIADPDAQVNALIAIAAHSSDPEKAVEILDQALKIIQHQTSWRYFASSQVSPALEK